MITGKKGSGTNQEKRCPYMLKFTNSAFRLRRQMGSGIAGVQQHRFEVLQIAKARNYQSN